MLPASGRTLRRRFPAGARGGAPDDTPGGYPRNALTRTNGRLARDVVAFHLLIPHALAMWKGLSAMPVCRFALAGLIAGSCSGGPVVSLAGGQITVSLNPSFSGNELSVTVRNEYGSSSGAILLIADHIRSNLYQTPNNQLVVIEQGGDDAFFFLPKDGRPEYLTGQETVKRDTDSDRWHYLGVVKGHTFHTDIAECIALLGEGGSPFRRQYQKLNSC